MLQLLRHLHPERDIVEEDKMLDPPIGSGDA